MKKRVIVIGAGAAGLTAAIRAAESGAEVTVVEHTEHIGKKLLMTGNGRCNYTNTDGALSHYHSLSDMDGRFRASVLSAFTPEDTIAFFRMLGIVPKIKTYEYDGGGYVYPASGEARSVLYALKRYADSLNVRFELNCRASSVMYFRDKNGRPYYQLSTNRGMLLAEALVLAGGACAMPKTGSDGTAVLFPGAFGHTTYQFLPALCALRCIGSFFRDLKGVRCDCRLRLEIAPPSPGTEERLKQELLESGADHFGILSDDLLETAYESYGEVQFTDYGLSGIPVFQLSRYVSLAVRLGRERYIVLDAMPEFEREALFEELAGRRERFAERTAEHLLNGLLPEKLARMYLKRSGIRFETGIYLLEDTQLYKLADMMKGLRIGVLDTNGFDNCQCCAGGVDTREIDPETMESREFSELYFAGELVDVDGDCGGYNLQWAWSSGTVAGRAAARMKSYRKYPQEFHTNSETYRKKEEEL
ncbi:MAG: NAD(P)/FAD-dependent oxidoreductase [Eubacteriales bacterium]|nr:NAD(P)/FAD-dependent oxidoreductase [Eubacteriales bacterium]